MKKRKANKKKHIKHDEFRDRNISSLESHPRSGKTLKNPFSVISPQMTPRSWVNECIPNILWACILATTLERSHYLRLFRSVATNIRQHLENHSKLFITHNYLAKFTDTEFDTAFRSVLDDNDAKAALSALLLVESMPDRSFWAARLSPPNDDHWQILGEAVAGCFNHQSQRATDIRWIKVIFLIIVGKLMFPQSMEDMLENFRLYPNRGDMRSVRPSIRAIEISTRMMEFGEESRTGDSIELPPPHQESFWSEMQNRTKCIPHMNTTNPLGFDRTVVDSLTEAAEAISDHFHATLSHTGLDARHDSSFGLVLYAIHLLTESAASLTHTTAAGRSILRSIVECFITLCYLISKDDPELWLKHRDHGNGQTKLSFLKNLSADNVPRFVDLKLLEMLANEDKWLEFQDINLGAWAEKNLRALAIEANVKDIYDAYYDLCSGYTHGHWTAIRDASFTICFNPLHRFHRIPAPINLGMRSILEDGITLINKMLDELEKIYPGLEHRITLVQPTPNESSNNVT